MNDIYNVILTQLCLAIENRALVTHQSFEDMVSSILANQDDGFYKRISSISEVNNQTIEATVARLYQLHGIWC